MINEGKSPIIFGDGEQTRDFTFVKDVAGANLLAAESTVTGVFNIARGSRITLNKLVSKIFDIIGSKNIKAIYQESRPRGHQA